MSTEPLLNITVVGDKELIAKFDFMPEKIRAALKRKVTELSLLLERRVKESKLTGQVLNVRTGNLRRSIHHRVVSTPQEITGSVFSSGDVKYAAIHEFGGKTPAHTILPNKAKALAFMVGGKMVFAASVNHPGSTMPMRSFLRSSLGEMRTEITQGMTDAIKGAAKV